LLPGYLLSIAMFPRRYDLAGKGRLALSLGADVPLILLLGIGLSLSPWGLHLSSLAASAAVISLVLAAIAHVNRSALPRWNRFVPFISGSGRNHPVRNREADTSRSMIGIVLVLAAAVALSALAYTTMNAGDMSESGGEKNGEAHFTEFYIQDENDRDHPLSVKAGSTATTVVGIWFNVSGANLTSENSSETSGDGTVALEQTGRVVALGVGKDKSSDKKRNSDSGKATQQVASQVASQATSKPQGNDEPEQFSLQEMESELTGASEQNSGSPQASPENASRETTATSSSPKSEILEGKERLVATAVVLETDDLEIDPHSGSSEVEETATDNPESKTMQTDQEAAKPGGDEEKDAPDTSSDMGDQGVSQKEEASETSDM
ncbi:MAG: DUF1616 domain-containing protein, partial [Methanotrichaceae archaeon]|nr:DUF1616 domain-containing protein [Methanotrichaceae archaeon]